MEIRIIVPVETDSFNPRVEREVAKVRAPDFSITIENLKKGPLTIESRRDGFLAGAEIVRASVKAQEEGVDGILIDCFGEPLVPVVREIVDIPVIGGMGAALMTANMISQRYSIVSVSDRVVPMNRALVREYGVENNVASMPVVGMTVTELVDEERLMRRLVDVSRTAIENDGAQAIILGCTGMLDVAGKVQRILADEGRPAPVVDPTSAAVTVLQAMIRAGYTQSRLTYPPGAGVSIGSG